MITLYTQAELAAAVAALKAGEAVEVPWYEQSAITDDLLNWVAVTALTAAAKARAKTQQGS